MTLFSYEIFDAVARQGSFIRAAEQLHLTPSAVSHGVAAMEAELGFSLFNRGKSGVTMTSYGRSLYPAIRGILNANENFKQTVETVNGLQKGVVRVGAFNSVVIGFLPGVLELFKVSFPQIDLEVYQGTYNDVIQWVRNGEVDFGFLSETSCPADLDFEMLDRDRLMCVVPGSWEKMPDGVIHPSQLRGKQFIIQANAVDADIKKYLKKYDLQVRADCRVTDDISMIAMVEAGFGIALMPELTLVRCPYNVVAYPVDPPEYRQIGLVTQRGSALSPAVGELMEYIRKTCGRKSAD